MAMAEPGPRDTLYDFYTGIGVIALYAAQRCARVLGLESNRGAIEDARTNAANNGITNATFEVLDLKDIREHRALLAAFGGPDDDSIWRMIFAGKKA